MDSTQPQPLQTAPQLPKTNKSIMYMAIFAMVVFLGLLIFFVFQQSNTNQPTKSNTQTNNSAPTPTIRPTKGTMSLTPKSGIARYSVNEEVILNLVADSDNEDISGYDTIVSYDSSALEFVKATSTIPEFKIFSFSKDNYLSITATKNLQATTPSVFVNTVLVELIFKPKTTGNFTVSVDAERGKESTKFVNTNTQMVYPKVDNIALEIY